MKTYSQKPSEVTRKWHVIDASTVPLGRLSTVVAKLLQGKHKPTYTPHIDGGDFVIVVNSDQTVLTGDKEETKVYYRHSGVPGNLRERTVKEQKQLDSTRVVVSAVKGMLPKNKLAAGRLERLKVYAGAEHKHEAQKPVALRVGKKA